MKAVTWQGIGEISVQDVPDPRLEADTDAIIRVTAASISGADLHRLRALGPFMTPGDVLGHETAGEVVEIGDSVQRLHTGDRVVIPAVIACGQCAQCLAGRSAQCETTRQREHDAGAARYGHGVLHGSVPGGQAEYLRVRLADANAIRVDAGLPDERSLLLGDALPAALQAVEAASLRERQVLGVVGLGAFGQLTARLARHRGLRVIGIDPVPQRRELAEQHGIEVLDSGDDALDALRDLTSGEGPDAMVDAVGLQADGDPAAAFSQSAVGGMPQPLARQLARTASIDRLTALLLALRGVARGGTVVVAGEYCGSSDRLPLGEMVDKQLRLQLGHTAAHGRWQRLMPLVADPADPLGLGEIVTHEGSLDEAPGLYELFERRAEGCLKVVLRP